VTTTEAAVEPIAREHRPGFSRAAWWGLAASAAFSAVFIARTSVVVRGRTWWPLFDDAMISMTYGRNLANGDGLVWTPEGERVEGITNLLWTLVMAGMHKLPIADRHVGLVVAIVSAGVVLLAGVLAHRLVRRLAPESTSAPTIALWLVALAYPLLFWSLRGFEIGILAVLSLGIVLVVLRLRDAPSARDVALLAVLGGAGVAIRLDFAVTVAIALVFLVLSPRSTARWRAAMLAGAGVAACVVIVTIFRVAYYGSASPNTLELKVGGVPMSLRLSRGLGWLVFSMLLSLGAALVLALPAMRSDDPRGQLGRLLCGAVFAGQAAYSVWAGGDAWEWMRYANRYVTQALPLLLCLSAIGIERLVREQRSVGSRHANDRVALVIVSLALVATIGWILDLELFDQDQTAVSIDPAVTLVVLAVVVVALPRIVEHAGSQRTAALVAACLIGVLSLPAASWWWLHNAAHVDDDGDMVRLGEMVRAVTTSDAEVAVVWAGTPVYASQREGVDLLGKNDSRIAELPPRTDEVSWYPGHVKWDYDISVFNDDPPDLIAQIYNPKESEVGRLFDAGYVVVEPADEVADLSSHPRVQHVHAPFMFALDGSPNLDWSALRIVEAPDLEAIDTIPG
jgi:hypothetical protein